MEAASSLPQADSVTPALKTPRTYVTVIFMDQFVPVSFALEPADAPPLLFQYIGKNWADFIAGNAYSAETGGTTMETVTLNPADWSALSAGASGKWCLEDAWPSVCIQDPELFFKDFQHHVFATYPSKAHHYQGKIYEVQLVFKGTCSALIWCMHTDCRHSGLALAMCMEHDI